MGSFQHSKRSDSKRCTVEVRWGCFIENLTIFFFLRAVVKIPPQTLIISPWLLFCKMIISQLELRPPVRGRIKLFQVYCDVLLQIWKRICEQWAILPSMWNIEETQTEKCVIQFVRGEICHWTLLWKRISLWCCCSVFIKIPWNRIEVYSMKEVREIIKREIEGPSSLLGYPSGLIIEIRAYFRDSNPPDLMSCLPLSRFLPNSPDLS